MEKNYRIHTNITKDTVLNVSMQQDYDFLEVLSLKLRTSDAYRLHSSNYGIIIGRVLANDAFGIPNAKVSVFIPRDVNDSTYEESIYPYTEVMDRDKDGRRYNLLPDTSDDDCYRVVGTFPNKRLVLDDDVQLDIYDRYYKFSTVTNNAGDYMIFGVPSGNQQIHVDIDLSDIGVLSQTPRDFQYKGYTMTMFDSPRQFKESTNLEGLAQIFSQNKSVFVYPFWGDSDLNNGIAAITRCDIQVQYKFEPTCVFMGSIISDNEGNSIGSRCDMAEENGMNNQLIAGEGTIEMIRKTPDGLIEEFPIQGNQLIDSDGVWCYQIPMNLDYVGTDEYGNIVPTDNPSKGIPTRTQVRFRISKSETGNEGHSRHTAKYLVPMNPPLMRGNRVASVLNGKEVEEMYEFGSSTPQSCFRDMYWNNVYSVKNYIPKSQVANRPYSPDYTALKGSNLVDNQNPVPFNKLRIDLPFVYAVVCIIFDILIVIVTILNVVMSILHWLMDEFCLKIPLGFGTLKICPFGGPFAWIFDAVGIEFTCISLGGGLSDDNKAFYPGCSKSAMEDSSCPDGMDGCKKSNQNQVLRDRIQQKLAEDYKIVKLDFYQDWLNGSLYMPLWYWRKSKKKKFLFFTIASAKNEYCDCNKGIYSRLKTYVTCNFKYTNENLGVNNGVTPTDEDNWHRNKGRADKVFYANGLIKAVENDKGLKVYYYTPMNPTSNAGSTNLQQLSEGFPSVILYATDIILLGNLNENNIYGIPQLFNNLPSTTANIPPIATRDDGSGDDADRNTVLSDLIEDEKAGNALTTGMDWLHDGDEDTPSYKQGLFMDLHCTSVNTRAKSCINVERLSELGMNLDMQFSTEYPRGGQLTQGTFETDGFITKIELDDTENRAMFATLNHVGFMPQDYQDIIKTRWGENIDTQILDESGYLIPKFKYLYPLDLDGRMQPSLEAYKKGFQQSLIDHQDLAYLDFRLGDSGNRHFYNGFSMPLYRNSYYFYFGVNKGNTAIEKFRKMFLADCFKKVKYPFTYKIEKRNESYCKENYKNPNDGMPYIKFTSTDIQQPYSLLLSDINGVEVYSKVNSYSNEEMFFGDKLKNGSYSLLITDGNGRKLTARTNLTMGLINFNYTSNSLGTKFVEGETQVSTIKEQELYGEIEIDTIIIDEYEFEIWYAYVIATSPDEVSINIQGGCKVGGIFDFPNNLIANLVITKSDDKISGDLSRDILWLDIPGLDNPIYDPTGMKISLKVLKPCSLNFTIKEYCNNQVSSKNVTSQVISVANGQKFESFINDVPTEMLTKASGGLDMITGYDINTNEMIHRWLMVNNNEMYKNGWPDTIEKWNEYISLPYKEPSEFNPTISYQIGDAAYYGGKLYKFEDNFSIEMFDPREKYFGNNVVAYSFVDEDGNITANKMYRFANNVENGVFNPLNGYASGNTVIYNDGEEYNKKNYIFTKNFDALEEFNPSKGYSATTNVVYNGKMYQFTENYSLYKLYDEFDSLRDYNAQDKVSSDHKAYEFLTNLHAFNPSSDYSATTIVREADKMYYFNEDYFASDYTFIPSNNYLSGNVVVDGGVLYVFNNDYNASSLEFNSGRGYDIHEIVIYEDESNGSSLYEFIRTHEENQPWNYADVSGTTLNQLVATQRWSNATKSDLSQLVDNETWPFVKETSLSGESVIGYNVTLIQSTNIEDFNPTHSYTIGENVNDDGQMYKFIQYFEIEEFNLASGYSSESVVTEGEKMYIFNEDVSLYKVYEEFNPLNGYTIGERVNYYYDAYEFNRNFNLYKVYPNDTFNPLSAYTIGNKVVYGEDVYEFIKGFKLYPFDPLSGYTSGTVVIYNDNDQDEMYRFNTNVSLYRGKNEFNLTSSYENGDTVQYNKRAYVFNQPFSINSFNPLTGYTSGTVVSDNGEMYRFNEDVSLYRLYPEFNPLNGYSVGNRVNYDNTLYEFKNDLGIIPEFNPTNNYTDGTIVSYQNDGKYEMYEFVCTLEGVKEFDPASGYSSGTVVSLMVATESSLGEKRYYEFIKEFTPLSEFNPSANYDSGSVVTEGATMFIFNKNYIASEHEFNSESAYVTNNVVVHEGGLWRFITDHAASGWNSDEVTSTTLMEAAEGDWREMVRTTTLSNQQDWGSTAVEYKVFALEAFNPLNSYFSGDIVSYQDDSKNKMYEFKKTFKIDAFDVSSGYSENTVVSYTNGKMYRFKQDYVVSAYTFSASTDYEGGSVVTNEGEIFKFISNYDASVYTFSASTDYSIGSVVREEDKLFIFENDYYASAFTFDVDSAYTVGDVVVNDNNLWEFIEDHTAGDEWNDDEVTSTTLTILSDPDEGAWQDLISETSLSSLATPPDGLWCFFVSTIGLDSWSDLVVETKLSDDSWSETVKEVKLSDGNSVWSGSVVETKLSDDSWTSTVKVIDCFNIYEFDSASTYSANTIVTHKDEDEAFLLYILPSGHATNISWDDTTKEMTSLSNLATSTTYHFISETTLSDGTWTSVVTELECVNVDIFDSASTYKMGDIVKYNESWYKFTADHTGDWSGGTDTTLTSLSVEDVWSETVLSDENVWGDIVKKIDSFNAQEFNSATTYSVGDVVTHDGGDGVYYLFKFTSAHTGSWNEEHVDLVDLNEENVWKKIDSFNIYEFNQYIPYSSGDIVIYNGSLWEFIEDHTAGQWKSDEVSSTTLTQLAIDPDYSFVSATTLSDPYWSNTVQKTTNGWESSVIETKLYDNYWDEYVDEYPIFEYEEFDPTKEYISGNIVTYGNEMYEFKKTFKIDAFDVSSGYSENTVVSYDGRMYILSQGYSGSTYSFSINSAYTVGDVVLYQTSDVDDLYMFVLPHMSGEPWSFDEVVVTYLDELAELNEEPWSSITETRLSDNIWSSTVTNIKISDLPESVVKETVISGTDWTTYVDPIDYKDYSKELSTAFDKVKILNYELDKIFKLSKAVYDLDAGSNSFVLTVNGGAQPILYRSFSPSYGDEKVNRTFVFSDDNTISIDAKYPNIIGSNFVDYKRPEEIVDFNQLAEEGVYIDPRYNRTSISDSPRMNRNFDVDNERVGNYLAAFTNDGGYVSDYKVKEGAKYIALPPNAPVNITQNVKVKGEDETFEYIPSEKGSLIEGTKSNYYRLMSVDRRVDYRLSIIGPLLDESIIYTDETWKTLAQGTRVIGQIINGVEMSYDSNRNIISADTPIYDEDATSTYVSAITENGTVYWVDSMSATENNRLEYTYSYPSGTTQLSSITLSLNYEGADGACTWASYSNDMETMCEIAKHNVREGRIIPMLYDLNINGVDSRLMLWSLFNNGKLWNYIHVEGVHKNVLIQNTQENGLPSFYLFDASSQLYDGIYWYPGYRCIDVLYKEPRNKFAMNIVSCKYEPMISIDNVGRLSATMNSGKEMKFTTTFKSDVNVIYKSRQVSSDGACVCERRCSANPYDDTMKRIYESFHPSLHVEGDLNVGLDEEDSFISLKTQHFGPGVAEDFDYTNNYNLKSVTITTQFKLNDSDGYKYYPYLPKIFSVGEVVEIKNGRNYNIGEQNENVVNLYNYRGISNDNPTIVCANNTIVLETNKMFRNDTQGKKGFVDSEREEFTSMLVSQKFTIDEIRDHPIIGIKKKYLKNRENFLQNEIVIYNFADKLQVNAEQVLYGITTPLGVGTECPFERCGDHYAFAMYINWQQISAATGGVIKKGDTLEFIISQKYGLKLPYVIGVIGDIFNHEYQNHTLTETYYFRFNTEENDGNKTINAPYGEDNQISVLVMGTENGGTFCQASICFGSPDDAWTTIKNVHIEAYLTSKTSKTCYKVYEFDKNFENQRDFEERVRCNGCRYC